MLFVNSTPDSLYFSNLWCASSYTRLTWTNCLVWRTFICMSNSKKSSSARLSWLSAIQMNGLLSFGNCINASWLLNPNLRHLGSYIGLTKIIATARSLNPTRTANSLEFVFLDVILFNAIIWAKSLTTPDTWGISSPLWSIFCCINFLSASLPVYFGFLGA